MRVPMRTLVRLLGVSLLVCLPLACGSPASEDQPSDATSDELGSVPQCAGHAYYVSPTGSDASSTGGSSAPWRTFAKAIPHLLPGDCLFLVDGTYGASTATRYPYIDCATTAKSGVSGKPITIAAVNERKAFIAGNGSTPEPFHMHACAYWNVVGLHVEDGDFDTPAGRASGGVMVFDRSTNLVVRRNLVAHNNRYANSHGIAFTYDASANLVEENEVYFFHRHGIVLYSNSNGNEIRRNYANSRDYADLPSGRYSGDPTRGDSGFMAYGSSQNVFENNVSEHNAAGVHEEPRRPKW